MKYVFELREEAGVPRENPHMTWENMQLHKDGSQLGFEPVSNCHEVKVLMTVPLYSPVFNPTMKAKRLCSPWISSINIFVIGYFKLVTGWKLRK